MLRFRDVGLMAPLLIAGQALAGIPIADFPVVEPTPAAGVVSVPVAPPAGKAAEDEGAAGSPFEALIADFRWGAPEMGAEPYLPVPPPHRMRAEDAERDRQYQQR